MGMGHASVFGGGGPAQYVPPGGSITQPFGANAHQAAQQVARQNIINAANNYQSQFQQMGAIQQQAMLQQMYNQAQVKKPKRFMIEGKEMDLQEFVETLYPDDCPERTFLLLKLKGENDE